MAGVITILRPSGPSEDKQRQHNTAKLKATGNNKGIRCQNSVNNTYTLDMCICTTCIYMYIFITYTIQLVERLYFKYPWGKVSEWCQEHMLLPGNV